MILARALAFLMIAVALATSARALEPVDVVAEPAADLLPLAERYDGAGERLTFSTAPDAEGVVRRVEVRSPAGGATADWIVFALANPSDRQVDRLVVAPYARLEGSGWWMPDLASRRILAITPSEGFALERRDDDAADVFQVTLDPGAVVTFAAQLAPDQARSLPRLAVWDPDARKDAENAMTLYQGAVLGIAAVATMFAAVLMVMRGAPIFQAATLFATVAAGAAAAQFGVISRILELGVIEQARLTAWLELALAAALLIVPFVYLRAYNWRRQARWLALAWLLVLAGAAAFAMFDARIAATVARLSIVLVVPLGFAATLWSAVTRRERAFELVPAWLFALAWTLLAASIVTGRLDGPFAVPTLLGGLVLLAALVAVTVASHAAREAPLVDLDDDERRALALEGAGDAVFEWQVGADHVSIGAPATAALGQPIGALDGSLAETAGQLHPEDRDRFDRAMRALVETGRGRVDQTIRLRGAPSGTMGRARYGSFRLRARPLVDRENRVSRCVGTLCDVTAERTAQDRLMRDAVHDNLTGLPNRELFLDRVRSALALAQGESSGLKPAIVLIDLDRFAHINETFGTSTADNVLVSMARRLLNVVKPQDCLARLGADRFALLVLSEPDPEGMVLLADRLQRAVRLPVSFGGEEIAATASLGVVAAEPGAKADRARAETLLADAEIAVAEAKGLGGDRVEPFKPAMRRSLDRDYHIENDLRHALDRREIEMRYQPIVALDDGRIAGFEALMRWRRPGRGLVPPDDFIPLAERNGLIVQLGVFALETAVADLRKLREIGDERLFVTVNISSRQLVRHDLIGDVKSVVERAKLNDGLKLELTESMVMDNPEQASVVLERVKALGVGLALDDFGTGYSSLAQLTRFPFDVIKIDRALVRDDPEDAERPVVLRALVAMAHELGKDVVAEGLETEAEVETVRSLGCRFGQGFLYGEPLDVDAASSRIKRQAKAADDRKAA